MESVLLATDGSDYARVAARRAVELAAERGATLYVVCVVDKRRFGDPALSSAELASIYATDHATNCVEEVAALATEYDVRVEGDVRHGIPHEAILECAADVDADVIVVGKHGDHSEHFSGVGRRIREESDRDVRVVDPEVRPT